MKRAFVRGVWGIYDNTQRLLARRSKIDRDVDRIIKNQFNEPFVTYIMGEDNFKRMQERGLNCVLINKDPYMFDLIQYQYRHKLEILRYAMEQDECDEIVWLDWDCLPQKKLPANFWEECGKKDVFQACFQCYRRKKCGWRKTDQRKVPNGGWIYMRDKTIPSTVIKIWETMKQNNDEPAYAKYTDEKVGGWTETETNLKQYWDRFEPMFCNIHKSSPYSLELLKTKDVCFIHYQG
jgi:hypothetical protein